MKPNRRSSKIRSFALAAVALVAALPTARAGFVTWGSPTGITGDSDVSTAGTLVAAFNMGGSGNASTLLNGVTFNPFVTSGTSNTSGNFTLSSGASIIGNDSAFGDIIQPFTNLSDAYQTLLQSGSYTFNALPNSTMTLSMSNLLANHQYQFQWWSNAVGLSSFDPNPPPGPVPLPTTTATAGNSVSLLRKDSLTGLGQFAIGTFTATAPTQSIVFSGAGTYNLINGFQLRDLGAAAVPEPTAGLFGIALSVVAIGVRRARRARAERQPRFSQIKKL